MAILMIGTILQRIIFMKKTAFILATMLALTACGGDEPVNTQTDTATTQNTPSSALTTQREKKAEHYAVGTVPNTPPFIFKDEYGLVIGFDIDLLQAIADDQNFSFELFPVERSVLWSGLESNRYQLLVANLAITPERQTKYGMSKPYIYTPNIIMGKEGGTVRSLAQVGSHRIAVPANSQSYDVLQKSYATNIVSRDSLYAAYGAFMRGEAEYVMGDAGVLRYHHANSGLADQVKVYSFSYDGDESAYVGYAVRQNDSALLNKINTGLNNVRANGKYDEIYQKWFGNDASLKVPKERL